MALTAPIGRMKSAEHAALRRADHSASRGSSGNITHGSSAAGSCPADALPTSAIIDGASAYAVAPKI